MKCPRLSRFTFHASRLTSRYRCLSERKTYKTVVPRFRKRLYLSGSIGDTTASGFSRLFVFLFSRFLVFAITSILLITQPVSAQVVDIPDPNLKQAIRETLQLPAGQPITQQEMLRLKRLEAWRRDINDLTGIQHAAHLEVLILWGNQIKDLTPLANLTKLRELGLAYNAVESVEPLAGLIQLQRLNLTINRVQDITPLANLVHLQGLYIRENLVTDITPLANLTNLTELTLSQNQVRDLNPLMNLTALEILQINMNAIVDITPLANLTNLTELTVSRNQVRDLNPLTGLTRLILLNLSNNHISDLTPLVNLTALEILRLNMNEIVDITPLSGLKNLKELWLADNPIGDFSPLTQLVGVKLNLVGVELNSEIDLNQLDQLHLVVEIPDPNLENVIRGQLNRERPTLPPDEPITQLDMLRLKWLDGRGKNITDLTGLEYATNLTHLYLCCNNIESVKPLEGLTNLSLLDLYFNQIQDVTPLSNLVNLEKLGIHENLVTDITPLLGLNLIEFKYDEVCDFPPIAPPVRERMESRSFPSVFAWGGDISTLGLDHLTPEQRAALHDLDFGGGFSVTWDLTPTEPFEGLATSLAGHLTHGRKTHQRQLDLNPNMIILFTVDYRSYFSDEALPPGSDFWLKDENGEIVRSPAGSPQLNFLKSEVQDLIVKRIIAIERCGFSDGVMLDQFAGHGAFGNHIYGVTKEEMIQAILNIFRSVRSQVREDFLILINAGGGRITRYTEYVNGSFMEIDSDYQYMSGMPGGYSYDGLKEIESTLSWLEENLRSPQINCLEGWGIPAEPPDSPENQRWMRVITTLSLTHSDGYVMYNTGWGSVAVCPECPYPWGPAHQHIWYDFWDADLGRPVGPKVQYRQNIEDSFKGLFIREFTNGWAVYNRSGTPQTITLPASATPVSDRGNNAASQTHLLPDLDGEIYLKAKNPADVNGDGEVNILDLVHLANNFGKSDPDPNGDGVVNLLDLTLVAQQLE